MTLNCWFYFYGWFPYRYGGWFPYPRPWAGFQPAFDVRMPLSMREHQLREMTKDSVSTEILEPIKWFNLQLMRQHEITCESLVSVHSV